MSRPAASALTLVELIITISLTAILAIPIGILLSEHLGGALRARDASVAMSLARREMERLDSLNNFCVSPDFDLTPPSGVPAPSPDPAYAVTRIVTCQAQASGGSACTSACVAIPGNTDNAIKRIEIVVTKSGSTDRLASLVSYRTKYVLFGS